MSNSAFDPNAVVFTVNAVGIHGDPISITSLTTNSILSYNGTTWQVDNDNARKDVSTFAWFKTAISGEGLDVGGDLNVSGNIGGSAYVIGKPLVGEVDTNYNVGFMLKDEDGEVAVNFLVPSRSSGNMLWGLDQGGSITTGVNILGLGIAALKSAEDLSATIGIGKSAGAFITSGSNNVLLGFQVVQSSTYANNCIYISPNGCRYATGADNCVEGVAAFNATSNATSRNNAKGTYALYSQTGSGVWGTTCDGYSSLSSLTSGKWNVGLGYIAGINQVDGDNGVFLGPRTGPPSGSGSWDNIACLGADATVTGSYQVQLGGPSDDVYYSNSISTRSDLRDKTDIYDSTYGLELLMELRPVMFTQNKRELYITKTETEDPETGLPVIIEEFDEESYLQCTKKGKRPRLGLIAQELQSTLNEFGIDMSAFQDHSKNGGMDVFTINYIEMIPMVIKAVQELAGKIDEIEAKIS